MTPLRATIESDLRDTLQGEFASVDALGAGLVTLVDPDGVVYSGLKGQVLFDYRRVEPTTGETVLVHDPVVTLRRSSLTRVPLDGERWEVRMPLSPVVGAPITSFLLGHRAPEGGQTLGIIRLYPRAVRLTPAEILASGIATLEAWGVAVASPTVAPLGIPSAEALGVPSALIAPISTTGLEALWHLDEGVGSTSADSSGHGRDLTTLQNTAWADGKAGKCLSFVDRTVARAAYGAAIDASAWTAFSISWWCNKTLAATGTHRVISFGKLNLDGLEVYTDASSVGVLKTMWGRAGASEFPAESLSAFDATLRHYVVTFNVSTRAWVVYRDGIVRVGGTLAFSPVLPNRHPVLGNLDTPNIGGWADLIDEVWLYSNRVLTPAEVISLFQNPGQV